MNEEFPSNGPSLGEKNQASRVPHYEVLSLKGLLALDRKIKKRKKIVMDVTKTKYDVVKRAATDVFEWSLLEADSDVSSENEDEELRDVKNTTGWHLMWCDTYIPEDLLRKMLPYQRINHFPGSHLLGMKNNLCKNLNTLRKVFPEEYDFFPRSWHLPYQLEELRNFHAAKVKAMQGQPSSERPYYIVKPEASCQGRGIFITKSPETELGHGDHYVVQEYMANPYLLDGMKFDFRVYVLVRCVNPLRVYLFREGLARLATDAYEKPNQKNSDNMCMHLTNYAVNKNNDRFVFNSSEDKDDVGHKRSLSSVLKLLESKGEDVSRVVLDIRRIILKTICTVQPILAHIYRACQNKEENNGMCFEILGFDIMLDDKLKPWLIEVNHTPSFTADTPLDLHIKRSLVTDTLNIINPTNKAKKQYQEAKKDASKRVPLTLEEKEKAIRLEEKRAGGFIKIYPTAEDDLDYTKYMETAKNAWDNHTGAKKRKVETNPDLAKGPKGPQKPPERVNSNKQIGSKPPKDVRKPPGEVPIPRPRMPPRAPAKPQPEEEEVKITTDEGNLEGSELTGDINSPSRVAKLKEVKVPAKYRARTPGSENFVQSPSAVVDISTSQKRDSTRNPSISGNIENVLSILKTSREPATQVGDEANLRKGKKDVTVVRGLSQDRSQLGIKGYTKVPVNNIQSTRVPMKINRTDLQDFADMFLVVKPLPTPQEQQRPVNIPRKPAAGMSFNEIQRTINKYNMNYGPANNDLNRLRLIIQRKGKFDGVVSNQNSKPHFEGSSEVKQGYALYRNLGSVEKE
eukprot:TRINITY_DN4052_c0_g3_i1.p1 TRINITY_DN4052_c0_g3~~TRINITY_DN4052_c0_g3_i1.p1  ORF type:complete len:797 (-),score=163.07 TRINITY_DN4052_c0_g3_i1:125-2515(-)